MVGRREAKMKRQQVEAWKSSLERALLSVDVAAKSVRDLIHFDEQLQYGSICKVCLDLLKDPCLRVPCGHVACAECIERVSLMQRKITRHTKLKAQLFSRIRYHGPRSPCAWSSMAQPAQSVERNRLHLFDIALWLTCSRHFRSMPRRLKVRCQSSCS